MNHHKMTIKPFKQSDLDSLELLEEKDIVLRDREILHKLGASTSKDEFCGSTYWGDELVFIGGWKQTARGVIRVFVIPTQSIFKHPIRFTKTVMEWLLRLENRPETERIVTLSRCNQRIDSWMVALGFVYEATLKRYADGHDYRVWVRNKRWDSAA